MKKMLLAGMAVLALGSVAHAEPAHCDARVYQMGDLMQQMENFPGPGYSPQTVEQIKKTQGYARIVHNLRDLMIEQATKYLADPGCQQNRSKVSATMDMLQADKAASPTEVPKCLSYGSGRCLKFDNSHVQDPAPAPTLVPVETNLPAELVFSKRSIKDTSPLPSRCPNVGSWVVREMSVEQYSKACDKHG